eukprot:697908-Lingulodinium_polyedra.AAC.2
MHQSLGHRPWESRAVTPSPSRRAHALCRRALIKGAAGVTPEGSGRGKARRPNGPRPHKTPGARQHAAQPPGAARGCGGLEP